jgi:WD40 repeat protein
MKAGSSSRWNFEVEVVADAAGAVLALGKHDKKLFTFDVATGKERDRRELPSGTRTFAFTPDHERLIVRVETETHVVEYPSLREVARFDPYCNQNGIAISPDGKWLAVNGHEVHVFDLRALKHRKTFEPPESPWALAFTSNSAHLVTGDGKNMLRVYDEARDFALATEIGKNRSPTITALATSDDGRYIATANELGTIVVYNAGTLSVARELKGHDPSQPDTGARNIGQIAFVGTTSLVVSAAPKKEKAGLTIHDLS